MSLKAAVKHLLPRPIAAVAQRRRLQRDMAQSRGKSLEEIFTDIYARNLWGGPAGSYYSGSGSTPEVVAPYAELVRALAARAEVRRIVDLGCGDFRVGSTLLGPGISYVGCDIVPGLVAQNAVAHQRDGVSFERRDIVTAALPDGDLCLVKQVFQNLSNAAITAVLGKLKKYRLVLITDEQVDGDRAGANADIVPYHGTRRVWGQGLMLERAPFHAALEILLEHSSGTTYGAETGTHLRTVLLRT